MKTLTTLAKKWNLLLLTVISIVLFEHSHAQESMRVSLYQLNADGTTNLADGNLTNYDDSYSNAIGDDALKMNNFGENFAIIRYSTKLAIEQRRKIYDADTTTFSMWNMSSRSYKLVVTTYNLEHPGLQGYFIDSYLNTSTPLLLNSTNNFTFVVNSVPGSYMAERFKIIFRNPTLSTLASLFGGFSGRLNNNKVELQWIVNNENAMREYSLERSFDRVHFSSIYRATAENTGASKTYNSLDLGYTRGDNFYRVKAVGLSGDVQYSPILKINGGGIYQDVLIYPNPIADNKFNITFNASQSGKFLMNLYNSAGSRISLTPIAASEGQNSQTVELPSTLPPGVYRLKIISPDNVTTVKTINVL